MKINFKKTCIALALAGGFVSVAIFAVAATTHFNCQIFRWSFHTVKTQGRGTPA